MALTEVIIANLALARIGEAQVAALSDKSDIGLQDIYDYTRDELLQYFAWKFAVARSQLTQAALSNSNIYSFKYPIPATSLRVLSVESSTANDVIEPMWDIEETNIVTNVESAGDKINIRYIKQITTVTLFTMDFLTCFTVFLASRLAIPIANDKDLEKALLIEFYRETLNAFNVNSVLGKPYSKSRVEQAMEVGFLTLINEKLKEK
ncbi:hypothetical protein LCGC14_0863700 [marine sediment metagenome]|uniref:Uncharacterized protein n=1 Tax=marine sediment metagenome TaxID=412755 RepID=A0A0F9PBN2_9ZZZZ